MAAGGDKVPFNGWRVSPSHLGGGSRSRRRPFYCRVHWPKTSDRRGAAGLGGENSSLGREAEPDARIISEFCIPQINRQNFFVFGRKWNRKNIIAST